MTFSKSFNVWVIHQINSLEHSMLSFFFHPEEVKRDLANFDLFALRCCNKRQGRKQFDDETLFGKESNLYTKIAFTNSISH